MGETPQRPAFTVSAAAARPSLPVGASALASFGVGSIFAAAVQHPLCTDWCTWAAPPPSLLALAALAAAVAWFALPLDAGLRRTLHLAGVFCILAGALTAIPLAVLSKNPFAETPSLPLLMGGGLAAPALMLSAASPGASLELGRARSKGPAHWLRMGALPATALFAGLFVSLFLHLGGAIVGPGALALAGALLILSARRVPAMDGAPRPRHAGRPGRLFRMTPMLRLHALGEVAVAFVAASSATVALQGPRFSSNNTLLVACAFGGAAGCAVYAVLSPAVDAAWGRGRLLSLVLLCAALAPLFLLGGPQGPTTLGLFGACALLAFALSASPQRAALAFDLSSSQGRLRLSGDLQGLKLAAAATGPIAFLASEAAAPGLGPLAGAVVAVIAFALFAPALGSLGVPRHEAAVPRVK